MKYSRERFQNGSLRRVSRKTSPDVWEFRFRDHSKPGLPMRQMTLSTVEYQTETAARRALQALLLKINGSEAYIAQRSPTFGTVLDKFIADEHLKEIRAKRTGEVVDEGLKFSTTVGYLSVIKVHLRPSWSKVILTDIRPLVVQEWLKQLNLLKKTKQNIKAAFHRMLELAMLWELLPVQRNPLGLVEIKGGTTLPRRKKFILTAEQFQQICNLLEEPYRTMVTIAMCLGLRVSEILALKWTDFDFEEGTLMITRGTVHGRIGRVKTEYSEDEMPLDPAFAEVVLKWRALCPTSEQGWVFPNPNTGGVWHSSVLQGDILVPAGENIGIA
jgi:integrase